MNRVSTNMATLDSQYHTMMREWEMNRAQNRMQSGLRIQDLRDDPLAAAKSTRLGSTVVRMEQYSKNIDTLSENLTVTEEKITGALERIHRLRELAVQGANGIYDKEQMGDMAREVDQHLEALAEIANSQDGLGNSIFAGFDAKQSPFMVLRGRVENGVGDHIVEVLYRGDIGRNRA
ncbi:MAG: flagellar hook-associated protein 3, partial [Spirochaetaceae bacterium]